MRAAALRQTEILFIDGAGGEDAGPFADARRGQFNRLEEQRARVPGWFPAAGIIQRVLIALAVNPRAAFGRARHAGKDAAAHFRAAGADVLLLCEDSYAGLARAVDRALGLPRHNLPAACERVLESLAGGGMRITPGAVLDDGLLDLFIVSRVSRTGLLAVFPKVFSGRHVDHPAVHLRRVRKVELTAGNVVAYADGERIGALPLTIEVVPRAVRVLA